MEATIEKKKVNFEPPTEKVIIKPIMRNRTTVTDPKHEAYFLFGTSKIKYNLPSTQNGTFKTPFTKEGEQVWLEKKLDLDLNIFKKDNNFWKTYKVSLGKDPRVLNLQDPKDYLDYIVLKANTNLIAPSGSEAMMKKTYRYALVQETFEIEKKASIVEKKKNAYKKLSELESSRTSMIKFLKVAGLKVDDNSKEEFLTTKLGEMIENSIDSFLKIANDENFDKKLLFEEAIACGAIVKVRQEYYLPGGDKLAADNKLQARHETAIEYLWLPENQVILDNIKQRIKASKE